LQENKDGVVDNFQIIDSLQKIKAMLLEIKEEL